MKLTLFKTIFTKRLSHFTFNIRVFHNSINKTQTPTFKESNKLIGTKFEQETISTLTKYRFKLQSTKSSHDEGIDFIGKLLLNDSTVPIVGQCKRERKPSGAKYIRELEGVLSHQQKDEIFAVGVFVSYSGFTRHALRHMLQSPFPLMLCKIENGEIVYLLMNDQGKKFLPSLHVGIGLTEECKKRIVMYQLIDGSLIKLNDQ